MKIKNRKLLRLIRKYLNKKGYKNWKLYFGGYNGIKITWIGSNGAHCQMDGWTLLNNMLDDEFKTKHMEIPKGSTLLMEGRFENELLPALFGWHLGNGR